MSVVMPERTAVTEQYRKDGFCIFKQPTIDRAMVEAARAGMEEVRYGRYETGLPPMPSSWNPGDDPQKLCKIELPQRCNHAIGAFLRATPIGAAVAAVTGAEMVQIFWVQLLYKPATPPGVEKPTKVGWHRDWNYFQSCFQDSNEVVTAWCALSDVDEACGPMLFVPGSHRWNDLSGGNFYSQENKPEEFTRSQGEVWKEVPAVMSAGGFSLHHAQLIHGSGPNRSSGPRCSFAIHMRTERCLPKTPERRGLIQFLDDFELNPIIYGRRIATAF